MANPNTPRGLIPVRHRNGAPYTGTGNLYFVPATYATNIFVGDPVVTVTAAGDTIGNQTVAVVAAGDSTLITGVVVSIAFGGDPTVAVTRDLPPYHQASTAGYVWVEDNPDIIFEVQVNGTVNTGAVGRNTNLVSGTGSTVTGYSGWLADTTLVTTNTKQLRFIAPVVRADNDITLANSKWLVMINQHAQRSLTGI